MMLENKFIALYKDFQTFTALYPKLRKYYLKKQNGYLNIIVILDRKQIV